jgi:hypothetical protein
MYGSAPSPYGSPLFGSNNADYSMMMEQQMNGGGGMPPFFSQRRPMGQQFGPGMGSPYGSAMGQSGFGGMPMHLPPAFAGLSSPMLGPVAGRSPFQRSAGVEMGGSGMPGFMGMDSMTGGMQKKKKREVN